MQLAGQLILVLLVSAEWPAARQTPAAARTDALRVFLDCESCDETYLRTEVTFVDHVRDREVAELHVLVTTQDTGGGATEYTLRFIGLQRFAGVNQTLTYIAPQTSTADETRRGFASVFRLGLVRYVAETAQASGLTIGFDLSKARPVQAVRDAWNFWIFNLGVDGSLEGEESQSEKRVEGSLSANRTTERSKVDFGVEYDYSHEKFTLDEAETFQSVQRELEVEALVVKSLTSHWSAGAGAALLSSTFSNYDLRARMAPVIEYNVFPYAESTRRILTLGYAIGAETADYKEETIYGKTSESLVFHQLETSLGLRQPWGSAAAALSVSQYPSDPDKYRITADGNVDVRLFKGFSLELSGSVARRRDQLSLRRGDATNEEILVRQRELATGYEYELGFGISYTFGSIFNNVVNPRFRDVGGF